MLRRPLGRGLDALIENTLAQPPVSQVSLVRLDEIAPGLYQPRTYFDPEGLAELAQAIKSQGIIEPLIVRLTGADGLSRQPYQLIAGERRLRAARLAGLERVPVLPRELDDRGALEMALVENLAREELNPVEEGRALKRLNQDFGQTHDDIAARIGKSRPYVSNAIRLLDLPEPVLDLIAQSKLTVGQSRPLLALASADAQIAAARAIVERGLTARTAEALAQEQRRRLNAGTLRPAPDDPNLNALVEGLQRTLKRKVRIIKKRGKSPGRVELDYYDENDLTALASALMGESRGVATHAGNLPQLR